MNSDLPFLSMNMLQSLKFQMLIGKSWYLNLKYQKRTHFRKGLVFLDCVSHGGALQAELILTGQSKGSEVLHYQPLTSCLDKVSFTFSSRAGPERTCQIREGLGNPIKKVILSSLRSWQWSSNQGLWRLVEWSVGTGRTGKTGYLLATGRTLKKDHHTKKVTVCSTYMKASVVKMLCKKLQIKEKNHNKMLQLKAHAVYAPSNVGFWP